MSSDTGHLIGFGRNESGAINRIEIWGHGTVASCAVVSTISSFLEALLDKFNIPYEIKCEPKSGCRDIRTKSDNPDGQKLFETAAEIFRAASVCEPTRGYVATYEAQALKIEEE